MKTTRIFSIVFIALVAVMLFNEVAQAKPVFKETRNYVGTDGNLYSVRCFADDISGDKGCFISVNGGEPVYRNGWVFPNYPPSSIAPQSGELQEEFDVMWGHLNADVLKYDLSGTLPKYKIDMKVEDGNQISITSDIDCDAMLIEIGSGKIISSNVRINGHSTSQIVSIPAGTSTTEPLGLIVTKDGYTIYTAIFYLNSNLIINK